MLSLSCSTFLCFVLEFLLLFSLFAPGFVYCFLSFVFVSFLEVLFAGFVLPLSVLHIKLGIAVVLWAVFVWIPFRPAALYFACALGKASFLMAWKVFVCNKKCLSLIAENACIKPHPASEALASRWSSFMCLERGNLQSTFHLPGAVEVPKCNQLLALQVRKA